MKKALFAFLLLCPILIFGQSNSWDGQGILPNSKFRVLNICINVIYDVHLNSDPVGDANSHWGRAYHEGVNNEAIPDNLLDFMDTIYTPNNLHGFITRSFGESSFDSLQMIGDFVIVNVKESSVLALSGRDTTPTDSVPTLLDKIAFTIVSIQTIANNLININGLSTIYGRNQIEDYDFSGVGQIYFAHIIFRNITKEYGGRSNEEGFGGHNFKPIVINGLLHSFSGQGITVVSMGASIVSHEIGHALFGGNSFHTSGGGYDPVSSQNGSQAPFLNRQNGYGLISAAGKGLISCNGYERWRMHWKRASSPYYISARNITNSTSLNSDISKEDGNKSFFLRDFVTNGDAIRIKMPYKESDDVSNQYIWLENHQVGYNNKLDYLRWSDETACRPSGKTGIYAYYQVGRDILSGTDAQVWFQHERDNLKIIPAEGYWDYHFHEDTVNRYNLECVNWKDHDYWFSRETANPFHGYQDQEHHLYPSVDIDTITWDSEYTPCRKTIGTQIVDSMVANGDDRDAFSSYSKINMGTNPSTCNQSVFYNHRTPSTSHFTSQSYRNNQTTYLTGLSIEMIPQANHNMRVNICWNDYDIVNHIRWTGTICNKEQVNLTLGNTIELVQNQTVAQPYRDTETGLFAKTTLLYCDSGSHFVQQPHSTVIVSEKSKLQLKSGSNYWVKDSAVLWIKSGGKLDLEEGAKLKIFGTLIVDSTAVVTLKDSILFSQKALILIKPGGKLVVDGGCLTSAATDELWEGICVMGNDGLPQTTTHQGCVELKNGAVIENARCAISTSQFDWNSPGFYNTTGGIIRAANATFINNLRSVAFYSYSNTNGTNIIDNVSYFTNCNFIVDTNNFFAKSGDLFANHITLWDVRGVRFNGCTFSNTTDISGRAIYGESAGFRIDFHCNGSYTPCTTCPSFNLSTFSGFNKAVEVLTTGNQYYVSVDHSQFTDNNRGVQFSGFNNPAINRSNFNVTPSKNGVSLNNVSGYHVEENVFFNSTAPSGTTSKTLSGLEIFNSGTANNSIYRNIFENLSDAITVSSINGSSNSITVPSGLEFTCNSFTNNKNDIVIAVNSIIKAFQGLPSRGADNQFFQTQSSSLKNDGAPFTYYHSAGSNHAPYNPTGSVTILNTALANQCTSTFCQLFAETSEEDHGEENPGTDGMSGTQIGDYLSLQEEYDDNLIDFINNGYDEIIANYNNGNTEISFNHPAFAALNNLITLVNKMSQYSNHAIHGLLSDSILYMDNLKEWYAVVRTPIAKYSLIEAHFQTGNYEDAENVMNQMPDMFNFNDAEMIEHNNYQDFYYLKKDIYTSARNWAQMTDEEIDILKNIAIATSGRSAAMAQGVLCFFYDICLEEEVLEKNGVMQNAENSISTSSTTTSNIAVYPNPTSDEVNVIHKNSHAVITHIEIYNMMGIKLQTKPIHAQAGKIQLSGAKGVYMMRVFLDNGDVVMKKIVKK